MDFIKKHITLILLLLYVFLTVGAGYFVYNKFSNQKTEIERYKNNTITLMTEVDSFKTQSGRSAMKVQELELTADEFKKLCKEQESVISDLNIKVKYLRSVSTTTLNSVVQANVPVRDSIVYKIVNKEVVLDTIKYFSWKDSWNDIHGVVRPSSVDCTYNGKDTLTISAKRIPKQFLFIKYGTKYIEINAVNSNPSSSITYNKSVKIVK